MEKKINNEINDKIEENYCSFEVAKLLKEKGFGVKTRFFYYLNDNRKWHKDGDIGEGFDDEYWGNNTNLNWNQGTLPFKPFSEAVSRPTHSIAIKWIAVNFGIHIYSFPVYESKAIGLTKLTGYCFHINKDFLEEEFKTPYEATEAALLHTLKNLI